MPALPNCNIVPKAIAVVVIATLMSLSIIYRGYWNLFGIIILAGGITMLRKHNKIRSARTIADRIFKVTGVVKGCKTVWITSVILLIFNILGIILIASVSSLSFAGETGIVAGASLAGIVVLLLCSVGFLSILIWLGLADMRCYQSFLKKLIHAVDSSSSISSSNSSIGSRKLSTSSTSSIEMTPFDQ